VITHKDLEIFANELASDAQEYDYKSIIINLENIPLEDQLTNSDFETLKYFLSLQAPSVTVKSQLSGSASS
jgi:hypothetical protein